MAYEDTEKVMVGLLKVRQHQIAIGYDEEHDDLHGPGHLVIEARRHLNIFGNTGAGLSPSLQRKEIETAAALLISAIEVYERKGIK